MQDCYCGDAGDFGTYILLNALSRPNPAPGPGVNWYYAASGEQDRGGGGQTASLQKGAKGEERFRSYSPEIYDQLRAIVVSGPQCIAAIERRGFLPEGIIFFSEALRDPRQSPGGGRRSDTHGTRAHGPRSAARISSFSIPTTGSTPNR